MIRAPSLAALPRFPVAGGTCVLATLLTLLYWRESFDFSPLLTNHRVMAGEFWRLLSSTLLHGHIFHLLFNLYWVWSLGALLEYKLGHARTVAAFVFLALVSMAFEYAFFRGGVGLSGVVYGLFGYFWAQRGIDRDASAAADQNTTYLFIGWGLICIAATWMGTMNVANVAHAMGLVAGICLGRANLPALTTRRSKRTYYRVATALLLPVGLLLATLARPYVCLDRTRLAYDRYLLALDRGHPPTSALSPEDLHRLGLAPASPDDAPTTLPAEDETLRRALEMIKQHRVSRPTTGPTTSPLLSPATEPSATPTDRAP